MGIISSVQVLSRLAFAQSSFYNNTRTGPLKLEVGMQLKLHVVSLVINSKS